MDVLKEIHRWLRPGGLLLDLHQQPEYPRVEIVAGGAAATCIGQIDNTRLIANIHAARAALASFVKARWFDQEATAVFDFNSHFATVDQWLAHRQARRSSSVLEPTVVERARELLSVNTAAELLVRERVLATLLRRRRR